MDPLVDLSVTVGDVELPNPVMNASGTVGNQDELFAYGDFGVLGAFVTKSLANFATAGNPPPRVIPATAGMLNSVGLSGPGIDQWISTALPTLENQGISRVVVSVWGKTLHDYADVCEKLAAVQDRLVAVEVNLSCPNLDRGKHIFAHDPKMASEVMKTTDALSVPTWAKLSPNTDRLVEVAGAVHASGAAAVTLTNTVMGMAIDTKSFRPRLGAVSGGLSGPAIHPVAVKAVYDCRAAHSDLPIVGVGGIRNASDAVELLLAGAQAVQIGTAHFANPRASLDVLAGLVTWCNEHSITNIFEICGAAHD